MGVDLDSPITLTDPLITAGPEGRLEDYLSTSIIRRGSLVAARARLRAVFEVRAAEGALRPQVYGMAMGDAASRDMMSGGTVGDTSP